MSADTRKINKKGRTRFVAHRGVSGIECENTAAAFLAAGNRSYYGVETDIWRTSDGKYICNHDGRTGRICETDMVIEKSEFTALRSLTLKDTDGKSDRAELILPTPAEYRKICEKYGKHCVPELKSSFTEDEIREILGIFDGYLDSTCFISFNMDNLDLVKKLRPEQECQFLTGWTGDYDSTLPEMLAERKMGLDVHYPHLTEDRVKACHLRGVEVNCWTVDKPEDAERLISWGVDYITTNILE